jgi:hypothetical protein
MANDIIINKQGMNIVVSDTRLKIGLGLSMRGSISPEFLMMLLERLKEWQNKYIIIPIIDISIPIDYSRNKIVNSAKKANCDYLFFIDSDVIIEKGQLEKLLTCNKDVVTGVYYQRVLPYVPLPRKKVCNNLYLSIEPDGQDIVDVDGTGMGCVLVKMSVFEKFGFPWFEFQYHRDHGEWYQLSEDLNFCQKVQKVGIRIYCDPTVKCNHIGATITPSLSNMYKELRTSNAAERDKTVTELNEFTGLSTEDVYSKWVTITKLVGREYIQSPKDFYKTNKNYVLDLTNQHMTKKRGNDNDIFKYIKDTYPTNKKILDFGCGCGQNAIMLAEAGYDVSVADFDGYTYDFAKFRTKKRGLNIKFYDIEMPTDDKFDVVLAFEVLDHIPDDKFVPTVELLKTLVANGGEVMASTNFGTQDGLYPMKYETSPEKEKLIQELVNGKQ